MVVGEGGRGSDPGGRREEGGGIYSFLKPFKIIQKEEMGRWKGRN